MRPPTIEILDPDGSYATLQPFDEIRAWVLASNVLGQGSVVHKPEALTWSDAAEDLGGFTRLGPSEIVPCEGSPAELVWDASELLAALGNEEDLPSRPEAGEGALPLEDRPASPPSEETEAPISRVGLLLGLVRHLRRGHLEGPAGSRRLTPCRCPGYRIPGGRIGKRLRILIRKALREPGLSRVSPLLRELEKRLGETQAA